jgi:hypothetical protein
MSCAVNLRRDQPELVTLMPGPFSPELVWIVETVDVNPGTFLTAELPDSRVAPDKIRPAAEDVYMPAVADVGAIKRINNDGGVTSAIINATTSKIRVRPEIPDVNEGVTFRSDVAGCIDP